MTSMGVRRRDTTKGPPLRILSLDGGGVRGYSMLIILQELMYRTYVETEGRPPRRDQIPKPCDVFDLIVGSGTGGLIALMLGRLRMDLETCKELYVRLTRVVFETDKTIAGIPYRSTLFKASKLEEVIKDCVQEHTVFVGEGNDGTEIDVAAAPPSGACSRTPRRHSSNASVLSFSARSPHAQMARPAFGNKLGNPEARLYDARENRTKTAVTAVYKDTPLNGHSVFLRSYDSRRQPPIEFDCKIWEAGRATCAIGLAFKPIQIGQSVFHDEGAGTFNPSPEALDEAVVNEWPGREVGVFLSVGTGRRTRSQDGPAGSLWYEGFMGGFAEARQRLISKIENCETVHEYMMEEHLSRRGVNIENYYRLNVEMGVGEFGMNEWHRLSDISTSTRRYLMRDREQKMVEGISTKLAKIHRARMRQLLDALPDLSENDAYDGLKEPDWSSLLAVELPAEVPGAWPAAAAGARSSPPSRQSYDSGPDHIALHQRTPSPATSPAQRASAPHLASPWSPPALRNSGGPSPPHASLPAFPALSSSSAATAAAAAAPDGHDRGYDRDELGHDQFVVTAPTPGQYRTATGADKIAIAAADERPRSYHRYSQSTPLVRIHRIEPPPIPPKTPLPEHQAGRRPGGLMPTLPPPYPLDEDEPPPVVNMSRKPDYRRR